MSKDLYVDIYLLISTQIKEAKAELEEMLSCIDDNEFSDVAAASTIRCIRNIRKTIKDYKALLERFEAEVEEPEA